MASWCYQSGSREWVTYDTADIAQRKAHWIASQGLGGSMYWELSGDFPADHGQAIVPCVARSLGHLDTSQNHLEYPESKWDNLKKGMA